MKAQIRKLATVLATLAMALNTGAAAEDVLSNEKCLECHGDKDLTKELPDGKEKSLFTDEKMLGRSVHAKVKCAECHEGIGEDHPGDEKAVAPVACAKCHEPQSHTFGASVHGQAKSKGDTKAADCAACHGTHEVLRRTDVGSKIHSANLVKTCGDCHQAAAAEVATSVHGKAMAKGEVDAATCLDCHAEHQISKLSGGKPSAHTSEACANCHASAKINSRFGLPGDRVQTFKESFHGLAAQGGSTVAANCASCHGYHKILPSKDPASTIHPSKLLETCGKCHPGASEHFVEGKIHSTEAGGGGVGETVNQWVKVIYLWLIGLTVVLLGLHNGIAWWRKVVAFKKLQGATVERMDLNQRFQHLVLMVSFLLLAVTGFALKFPNTWYAHLMGSEDIRRGIHRIAGLVMLGGGIYHIGYAVATRNGRKLVCDLWPRWRDLRDVFTNIGHLLLGRPKAKFGRFGYPEKIEYWAVVWGTLVMGVTGLAIWFKIDVTHWLPRWVVDVAVTIHYYEAILACLAILIWHFYHVMFDPDVYPMNFAWLSGKVPKKWHEEEHPLEDEAECGKADGGGNPSKG
ncbi:MAG: cytochrome b/b6 domain-containing protein [Verrucomicrobia bacterium]|nr:cytochrome b/b6 domain-containing protein [Verrucomicrobiota bacterium]